MQKSKTLLPMVEEFENLDDNCSEESEVKKEEEQDMFEDLVKGITLTFIFILERLSLVPPLSKFDLRELVRSLELQNISRSRKLSDFRGQSSTDNGLLKPEWGNHSNNYKDNSDINSNSRKDVEDLKELQDSMREEITENMLK